MEIQTPTGVLKNRIYSLAPLNFTKDLKEAISYVEKKYEGKTRFNGVPMINHVLEIAISLLEKGLDLNTSIATLLHEIELNGLIEEEIAQIDYRQANQKAGYVYIISNIGAFGENVYKIGMTRRLEPQERVDELGDASVPFNFDVHAMIFSDNAPALEAALHRTFNDRRLNYINNRREFFHVSLDEIKQVVKENHDKSVEFIDVPPADQYRETVKMRETNTRA